MTTVPTGTSADVRPEPIAELRDRAVALRSELAQVDAAAAQRLAASVIRPLDQLLGTAVPQNPASETATVRALALAGTRLYAEHPGSPELAEAVAALQDLAVQRDAAERSPADRPISAELTELMAGCASLVQTAPDGPYLVTNAADLRDGLGCPFALRPLVALCRCGASGAKPYCDGRHADVGFSDARSPDRVPDRRDSYIGQQVTIHDNRGICQHSGFCTDRLSTVFRAGTEPFVAPSGGRMDEIVRAVRDCPSGALSYSVDGVEAREVVDHHDVRPAAITVTADGPYRVTGGMPLIDGAGARVGPAAGASREHYALCRCGQSQNKPFCSGMHYYVHFKDPVPPADSTPTMFEWCGGFPALTRMTRMFYEKYVPEDPLLAPVFATMSADHPERVAAWLGEVFGGPARYSGQYGGYPRMLSQHKGKQLTDPMRARWVELLMASALDAGLPNDPEFRSAFGSYIEWGSRLAVENSQTRSNPPEHMPMPHWDWNTAAGPPGSRLSALGPQPEQAPIVLPGPADEIRFDHVKQLFRQRDRQSMLFAFDLWSAQDLRTHAEAILRRLRAGTMPCDGRWPADWIDTFDRWIRAGAPD